MVTTRYSDQQGSKSRQKVMRLYKRWHRPLAKRFIKLPLLHIESSLDRLGLLSPTHDQRSQQPRGHKEVPKVNGSHPGDNPLLRPTGIQMATKCYATLHAMAPTNNKNGSSNLLYSLSRASSIDSDCCRLPTTSVSQQQIGQTFQPVLINNSKFLKATHRTKIRKIEIPRSMVVEALSW